MTSLPIDCEDPQRATADTAVWSRYTPVPEIMQELATYSRHQFEVPDILPTLPLDDEPHVSAWSQIVQRARDVGGWVALSETVLQLRFPIEAGIAVTEAYTAVMRRGELACLPDEAHALKAVDADGVQITLHATAAGAIPVITCRARKDFETLVIACTRRNEPTVIPPTMGACVVAGFNNWSRIEEAWRIAQHDDPALERGSFLAQMLPHKARYQDRFIILSMGPYSSVPAERLGLEDADWLQRSLTIRRTHEATHYFTKRVFGSMQNSLFDEILADYAGIVDANGAFSAQWFCQFMGVDVTTGTFTGGRLSNYRGAPPLSDAAFAVLARAVVDAAHALEALDADRVRTNPDTPMSTVLSDLARGGLLALLGGTRRDGAARNTQWTHAPM